MRTTSQTYSFFVFENVRTLVEGEGESTMPVKRYKSLCRRAGGILRTVGLMQFLSFLAAKAARESEVHYHYLLDHLRRELGDIGRVCSTDTLALLNTIKAQDLPEYMRTTSDTLKLLQWHKRVGEILISGTAEGE